MTLRVRSRQCQTRTQNFIRENKRSSFAGNSCYVVAAFFLVFFLSGCVAKQSTLGISRSSYRNLPTKYQKQARAYEKKSLLPEAIQSWQVALYFHPEDLKIQKRIDLLQKKTKAKAGAHFKKGVGLYNQGQLSKARKEFLLALSYDPGHASAFNYVTSKLQKSVQKTYLVQAGDSLKSVAQKEYNDPGKDILIAGYNDLNTSGKLTPGKRLQLPILGKDFLAKGQVVKGMSKSDYSSTLPKVSKGQKRKLIKSVPKNIVSQTKVAKKNRAKQKKLNRDVEYYTKAKAYLSREDYPKALKMLEKVDVNYRDTSRLKASTEVFIQQEADAHYRKGISYFLAEDLEKAITEWQEVLRIYPNHLKAKKDLKNARKMQEKVGKY